MLILKYFNRIPGIVQDQELPEPASSLSNFVSPKTIEFADTEAEKVKNKRPCTSPPFLLSSCSLCFTEYVSEIFSLWEFHNSPNFPTASIWYIVVLFIASFQLSV